MNQAEWLTSNSPASMLEHVRDSATPEQLRGFVEACRAEWPQGAGRSLADRCIDDLLVIAVVWVKGQLITVPKNRVLQCHFIREIWNPRIVCKGCKGTGTLNGRTCGCIVATRLWITPQVEEMYRSVFPICDNCGGKGSHSSATLAHKRDRNFDPKCYECDGTGRLFHSENMPFLADALEEGGCINDDLLRHLRGEERCPKCLGEGEIVEHTGDDEHGMGAIFADQCECNNGWIPLRGPHLPQCWALTLLGGVIDGARSTSL